MHRPTSVRRLAPALLLTALIALAPGCMFFTTKAEGSQLRKEVRALRGRVERMTKNKKDTLEALKKAKTELVELKGILPQARAILLRNSARFGAKLDRLSTALDKLKGRLENVESDLSSSSKKGKGAREQLTKMAETVARIKTEVTRLMAEVRKKPRPGPKTAEELFAAANVARLTGRGAKARQLYGTLIKRYGQHKRAEAASYFIGKSHFDAYDYRATVVAVSRQLKKHRRGRFAARGRLLSARSYFELKRCKTSIRILTRLVRTFPHDEATPAAKQLLLRVRRLRTISRYCRR